MAISRRGTNKNISKLKEAIETAKVTYWNYLKQNGYHDKKALKLEKQIELAEYNLYCEEYEDNRIRNWN